MPCMRIYLVSLLLFFSCVSIHAQLSFVVPSLPCVNTPFSASVVTSPAGTSSFSWTSNPAVPLVVNGGTVTLGFAGCTNVTLTCFALNSSNLILATTQQIFNVACSAISVSPLAQTICPGASATVTAAGASTYSWNNGSNTNSIVVNPATSTVYAVNDGTSACSATAVVSIFDITVTASSFSVCPNTQHTLTGSGAQSYNWFFPGGASSVNIGPTVVVTPTLLPATYTIICTNGSSCLSMKFLTLNQFAYFPAAAVPSSVCASKTFSLLGLAANAYTWSSVAQTTTSNPFVTQQSAPAVYSLTADSANCKSNRTFSVGIHPQPTLTIVGSEFTICANQTASLFASGAVNYTWASTPGMQSSVYSPSVIVAPQSTTVYSLVAGNSAGCTAAAKYTVTLGQYPSLGIVTGTTDVCPGYSTIATASGATNYSWTGTGIGAALSGSTVNLYAGAYKVIAFNGGSCKDSVTFNIGSLPSLSINVTASSSVTCIQNNGLVDPVFMSASGASYFTWTPYQSSQMTYSAGPSTIVTPTASVCYTVRGYNSDCDGYASVCITSGYCNSVIQISGEMELSIFPNPASDKIYLNSNHGSNILIYDCSGKLLMMDVVTDDFIDISALPKGMYILFCTKSGQPLSTARFVKTE